jgi:ribosomal protein L24E
MFSWILPIKREMYVRMPTYMLLTCLTKCVPVYLAVYPYMSIHPSSLIYRPTQFQGPSIYSSWLINCVIVLVWPPTTFYHISKFIGIDWRIKVCWFCKQRWTLGRGQILEKVILQTLELWTMVLSGWKSCANWLVVSNRDRYCHVSTEFIETSVFLKHCFA